MNRIASPVVSALLALTAAAAAAACGKKDQEPAGAATATATASGAATGAAQPAPDAAAPAPAPDAAAAASLTAGATSGPFASIDAYCAAVSAAFAKDACWSQMDDLDMCSCDAAGTDDVAGDVKASGASGNLAGARLVAVADAAADYVHCSIALELAGGSGLHVLHKAFPCNAAPISHDGGISVAVDGFTIADDTLKLAWTSDDGERKQRHALECKASATAVTCTPPTTK